MKIFTFKMSDTKHTAVYKDAEEAYEKRAEIDQTFAYLPVEITEFTVGGYDITLTPQAAETPSATLRPAAKKGK